MARHAHGEPTEQRNSSSLLAPGLTRSEGGRAFHGPPRATLPPGSRIGDRNVPDSSGEPALVQLRVMRAQVFETIQSVKSDIQDVKSDVRDLLDWRSQTESGVSFHVPEAVATPMSERGDHQDLNLKTVVQNLSNRQIDDRVLLENRIARSERILQEKTVSLCDDTMAHASLLFDQITKSVDQLEFKVKEALGLLAQDVMGVAAGIITDERQLQSNENAWCSAKPSSGKKVGKTTTAHIFAELHQISKGYQLRESVWDAAFFLGLKDYTGYVGNYSLIVGVIVQCLFDGFVSFFMFKMAENDSKMRVENGFRGWNSTTCNAISSTTDFRLCASCDEQEVYEDAFGFILSIVAMAFWSMHTFYRLNTAEDFMLAISYLHRTNRTRLQAHLRRFSFESITYRRFVWGLMLGCMRMMSGLVLLVAGVMWLKGERDLITLIVKLSALTSVITFDQVVYTNCCSTGKVMALIKNLALIEFPRKSRRQMFSRRRVVFGQLFTGLVVLFAVVYGVVPEVNYMMQHCL